MAEAKLTITDQSRGDAFGKCHQGEPEDRDTSDTSHQVCSDVHVVRKVVGVYGEEATMSEVLMVANLTHIMIAMNEPYGICSNVVLNVSNPKPLITSVPTESQQGRSVKLSLTVGGGTIGHVGKETKEEVQIRLWVFGPFDHLIPS